MLSETSKIWAFGYWTFDGAQSSGFKQSWNFFVVHNIQRMCYKPVFFENDNVTRETFRTMLIQYAFSRFWELRKGFIFLQECAPLHHSNRLKTHLDRKLLNRWIGGGEPILWPLRSLDLLQCDFFLWKHIKWNIYETLIYRIVELKIGTEINKINQEALQPFGETQNYV